MTQPVSKTSPIVIAAAIAVILFSLIGIAALTGILPGKGSKSDAQPPVGTPVAPQAATGPSGEPEPAKKAEVIEKPRHRVEQRQATQQAVPPGGYPPPNMPPPPGSAPAPAPVCPNCGVIASIQTVEQPGEGSALGAIAGGVVGGLLGNQVGSGTGREVATVAGALGGGYAGTQIEKQVKSTKVLQIAVRMEDGRTQTVTAQPNSGFAVGQRVKVVNGALQPY